MERSAKKSVVKSHFSHRRSQRTLRKALFVETTRRVVSNQCALWLICFFAFSTPASRVLPLTYMSSLPMFSYPEYFLKHEPGVAYGTYFALFP